MPAWATQRQAEANDDATHDASSRTTPSNRELARDLGVSSKTVDRAEQRLQAEADPEAPAQREATARPSKVEQLETTIEQLHQDLVVARQERDAAQAENRLLKDAASPSTQVHLRELHNKDAEIRSLKAETSQVRIRYEDTIRRLRVEIRQLKKGRAE